MVQPSVSVPWGAEIIHLALPEAWHIQGVLEPASIAPVHNPDCDDPEAMTYLGKTSRGTPAFAPGEVHYPDEPA